ncbi:MAG: hypothetical protein AAGD07_02550 [Planctomycetota bacterium]
MSRHWLFLGLLLTPIVETVGHELPDDVIERRVQISVKPDRVLLEYSLTMNDTTLAGQLAKHDLKPAETSSQRWDQFQELALQSLPATIALTVDGHAVPWEPIRSSYSGWSHRQLSCLFAAYVRLTARPTRIVVADHSFPQNPGEYRIAMKSRSGAKMADSTVPVLVSGAQAVSLEGLKPSERLRVSRAEAEFSVAESTRSTSDTLFPDELTQFVPSEKNPVFAGSGQETWDQKIRERGCVLRHQGKWHLWYTGYRGERDATKLLGYASSQDGLTWARHEENPVFDQAWSEDVHVVHDGDGFQMVAEGRDDIPHRLTSPDGIQWTDHGRLDVRQVDGTPISPGPYGTPTLWVEDGTWFLFYERGDRGVWLAKSTDLQVWANVQDAPVIERGPAEYDRHAIALNQVIRHEGRYYGVYHANADKNREGPWTTCLAVSDDLVHWEKYPGNPLIRTNDSSGQFVHDGERYRLYTAHPDVRVYLSPDAKSVE